MTTPEDPTLTIPDPEVRIPPPEGPTPTLGVTPTLGRTPKIEGENYAQSKFFLMRGRMSGHKPEDDKKSMDIVPGAVDAGPRWFPGPTTIDIDREHPSFDSSGKEQNDFVKDYIERELEFSQAKFQYLSTKQESEGRGEAKDSDIYEALANMNALKFANETMGSKNRISVAEQRWWVEFMWWLRGVAKEQDRQKTPWLQNQQIVPIQHRDVKAFLDIFMNARDKFLLQIDKLKLRGPVNLTEAYLYFKYIVRRHDVYKTGEYLKDMDMFSKYFMQDVQKDVTYEFPRGDSTEQRQLYNEDLENRGHHFEEYEKFDENSTTLDNVINKLQRSILKHDETPITGSSSSPLRRSSKSDEPGESGEPKESEKSSLEKPSSVTMRKKRKKSKEKEKKEEEEGVEGVIPEPSEEEVAKAVTIGREIRRSSSRRRTKSKIFEIPEAITGTTVSTASTASAAAAAAAAASSDKPSTKSTETMSIAELVAAAAGSSSSEEEGEGGKKPTKTTKIEPKSKGEKEGESESKGEEEGKLPSEKKPPLIARRRMSGNELRLAKEKARRERIKSISSRVSMLTEEEPREEEEEEEKEEEEEEKKEKESSSEEESYSEKEKEEEITQEQLKEQVRIGRESRQSSIGKKSSSGGVTFRSSSSSTSTKRTKKEEVYPYPHIKEYDLSRKDSLEVQKNIMIKILEAYQKGNMEDAQQQLQNFGTSMGYVLTADNRNHLLDDIVSTIYEAEKGGKVIDQDQLKLNAVLLTISAANNVSKFIKGHNEMSFHVYETKRKLKEQMAQEDEEIEKVLNMKDLNQFDRRRTQFRKEKLRYDRLYNEIQNKYEKLGEEKELDVRRKAYPKIAQLKLKFKGNVFSEEYRKAETDIFNEFMPEYNEFKERLNDEKTEEIKKFRFNYGEFMKGYDAFMAFYNDVDERYKSGELTDDEMKKLSDDERLEYGKILSLKKKIHSS